MADYFHIRLLYLLCLHGKFIVVFLFRQMKVTKTEKLRFLVDGYLVTNTDSSSFGLGPLVLFLFPVISACVFCEYKRRGV